MADHPADGSEQNLRKIDPVPKLDPVSFDVYVVAAGFLGEAAIYALADGAVTIVAPDGTVTAVEAHDGGILAAALDAEAGRLVTTGDDGRVVATRADGSMEVLAEKTGKWIDQLALGPQGAIAFAAGRVAWVRLADGRLEEFPHEKAVGGVAFLPKGLRLVTATVDKARLLWVTAKGAPVDLEWAGAHTGATVSPDGKFLVTTMQEPALHGWRIEDAKHMRMTGYPSKVKSVSWSAKGRYLATAGANAAILWPFMTKDGPMGKPPLQLGPYAKLVTRVACHPSEDVCAIGYEDGLIMAVRIADMAEVVFRPPATAPVTALAWDKDGFRIAFGTETGEAGTIDIRA